MSDSPCSKRQKTESEPVAIKYPFVNYDLWMTGHEQGVIVVVPLSCGSDAPSSTNTSMRPATVYFSPFGETGLSKDSVSAQFSTVAHSPFSIETGLVGENRTSLYISSGATLNEYIGFRDSIPAELSHPYFGSEMYRKAQICDVLCNAAHRNPSWYPTSWSSPILDAQQVESEASLAIAKTDISELYRSPWAWDEASRPKLISAIIEAVSALAEKGDLVVPMRGLVCSSWLGGILFRLTQLFIKVTVTRSQISPKWDDAFFVVCHGKRFAKQCHRPLKLLKKLVAENHDGHRWGYSAPPVCFRDAAFVLWLQQINSQLIGTVRKGIPVVFANEQYPPLERLASQFRLKRFLFPEAKEERLIGFYFGSFNPVHENHIALALFAHEKLGVERVYMVPNQDGNTDKEEAVLPMSDRVAMLTARARAAGEWLEVLPPCGKTHRWESKSEIAESTTLKLFEDSKYIGQPVLLLGQDSWNKAIIGSSRDKTTRHFIGIAKISKCKMLVFPRSFDSPESTICNPPKPIRALTTVVEDYADPIPDLSSSKVRAQIKAGHAEVEGLHPSVAQYIIQHQLYKH